MKPSKVPQFSRRVAGVAVLAIIAGAWFLYSDRDKKPDFQTAEVARGDIEVSISASGKIQPKNFVDVGAQVSGQLKEFFFEVGADVKKGDLLAQIDETLASAKVEADRAQLKELEASFAQQQATLELSKANAARADMLYKADAISQAEYQASVADRKIAVARLDQLSAQIERQNSTLEADLATLEFTKIYAPMSGTIVSQSAVVGQTLNANQTTPTILRIADLSVMTVEADVSEADVLRVEKGQEAYFTTLGGGGRWTTTVRQVLPQPEVLNDVVLYKVLLDVDNKNENLKPEMTAQVFFVSGRAKDIVIAPVAALRDAARGRGVDRKETPRNHEGRAGVMAAQAREAADDTSPREAMRQAAAAYPEANRKIATVLIDGEARPRPVLVGLQNRTQAEILYGLEPGDVVVTGQSIVAPRSGQTNQQSQRPAGMGRRGPR
ncbi:MAG: efflux RND transporter periplasmic adaptor subunit [Parvularculaceae bacterium]